MHARSVRDAQRVTTDRPGINLLNRLPGWLHEPSQVLGRFYAGSGSGLRAA